MPSLKALTIMVVWTAIAVWLINSLGFADHFRDPLWTLGGGILLLVLLISNVWIYFLIAKDEPWKWMKQ